MCSKFIKGLIIMALTACISGNAAQQKASKVAYVNPTFGFWKATVKNYFPAKKIVKDLHAIGVTEILFSSNYRMGWYYQSKHPKRPSVRQMGKRDWLEELIKECEPYDIKVWAIISTASEEDKRGLNHPETMHLYADAVDEMGRKFSKYKNFVGVMPHEINAVEGPDRHEDDLDDFSTFCFKNFGERYAEKSMPETADPKNKWWRRFVLYKIYTLNQFVLALKKAGEKHGLKTMFCYYEPEIVGTESWRYGYDPITLEKSCDRMWHLAVGEYIKPYLCYENDLFDFGPTYCGANRSRNYSYTFHGRPVSFFESMTPLYVKEMREYYRKNTEWTKRCGDFYASYRGWPAKSLSLFAGEKNLRNWLNLMGQWQGGKNAADIAFAINPVQFVMAYPVRYNPEYKKKVTELAEELTRHFDLGGVLFESRYALDPEWLGKFRTIIIPEDMANGLSDKMISSLRKYVKNDGKIISVATPIIQARRDLTAPQDLTAEFTGAVLKGSTVGAYVKPDSKSKGLKFKKFWTPDIKDIKIVGGEVLVRDKFTQKPLLVKKGNGYLFTIACSKDSLPFFAEAIKKIHKSSIELENKSKLRTLVSTIKEGALCISFFNQGKAKLKIDSKQLKIAGNQLQLKNILTGEVLHEGAPESFKNGVPIEIKYLNEPLVLAVGNTKRLAEFKGIYPKDVSFEGMTKVMVVENPQAQITIPNVPGVKVAVYHLGLGAMEIVKALKKQKGINAFIAPRIDRPLLRQIDVLYISQTKSFSFVIAMKDAIRDFVKEGGSVIITHGAISVGRDQFQLFPEIAKCDGKVKYNKTGAVNVIEIVKSHPALKSWNTGETFKPVFQFDNVLLEPVNKSKVAAKCQAGAVLVTGSFGKGKVALYGSLSTVKGNNFDSSDKNVIVPEGKGLKLISDLIIWLKKDK